MKHMLIFPILSLLLSGTFALPLHAQQEASSAPVQLGSPGENAAWVVRFERKGLKPEQEANPRAIRPHLVEERIVRTPERRLDIATWSDGSTQETWYIIHGQDRIRIIMKDPAPGATGPIRLTALAPDEPDPFQVNFPELDWLNDPGVEVTEGRHQGRAAWHVRFDAGRADEALAGRVWQAWLDRESRLPIAFDDGIVTRAYMFLRPVPALPALPQRFVERLEIRDQLVARDRERERQMPR